MGLLGQRIERGPPARVGHRAAQVALALAARGQDGQRVVDEVEVLLALGVEPGCLEALREQAAGELERLVQPSRA